MSRSFHVGLAVLRWVVVLSCNAAVSATGGGGSLMLLFFTSGLGLQL